MPYIPERAAILSDARSTHAQEDEHSSPPQKVWCEKKIFAVAQQASEVSVCARARSETLKSELRDLASPEPPSAPTRASRVSPSPARIRYALRTRWIVTVRGAPCFIPSKPFKTSSYTLNSEIPFLAPRPSREGGWELISPRYHVS